MLLFSENIEKFVGATVKVNIIHKIYGNQHATVRCFQPLITKDKRGFIANNHEIFVYTNEIETIDYGKNTVSINGKMQTIIIEKIS